MYIYVCIKSISPLPVQAPCYRVANLHRMPYRSFCAKEPYNYWLFCGKQLGPHRHYAGNFARIDVIALQAPYYRVANTHRMPLVAGLFPQNSH